jgi:energy-coupling factor transporter ATP-binding protein EcfA2
MEYTASTHGDYRFIFPMITVVLGANGSGKSTLLRAIKDSYPSVYVEGGRTIAINDVVQLTRQNFNQYQNFDLTLSQYKGKRKSKLVDRIFDAIMVLIQQEQILKDAHSDAVDAWEKNGKNGDVPKREQPPLEELFEQYKEVFPHLQLSYNKLNGDLMVVNDNANKSYGPSGLSDGEKQVFSLMADMLQLDDEYSMIVVDEPELNLHPELAERLWTLLESEYQEKRFIYATHSIQFALRSNVDALYVISSDPSKISKIDNLTDMPRIELEQFLGGVPGILNAGTVVVTEGHEKSFDSIFYRWLLGDSKAEVFPCGNCIDVKQVISKQGLWEQISSDIILTGAIDCDFRSEDELRNITSDHVVTLTLHEAESYLCIPEVLVAAAEKIGSQENPITTDEVENIIFAELQRQRLSISLKRSFSGSSITVRMSLERSVLATITTKEKAMEYIKDKSAEEVRKAVAAMDEGVFEANLDKILVKIDKVVEDRDVNAALKFLPGKQLLMKLASRAGCKNGTDLMRSIKKNLDFESFPIVKELAEAIKASIAEQEASADANS